MGEPNQEPDAEAARAPGGDAAPAPVAAVPDYRIRNLDSFNAVTAGDRRLAALYFWYKLDCLVELAHLISGDFFRRPHLYLDLRGTRPSKLAELHARYGTDEKVPSTAQRREMFSPIFGGGDYDGASGDGQQEFPRLRDALLLAAARFAERPADEGVEGLKEGVRTSVRPFKLWLRGFLGASITWTTADVFPDLTEARVYQILRTQGITAVFGIGRRLEPFWPYDQDPNADKFIEQAFKQLMPPVDDKMPMTREHFSNIQRAALRGAEAIATALDYSEDSATEDADLAKVITKSYTWLAALQSIDRSYANRPSAYTMPGVPTRAPYSSP
jgi:hypothetical protein